MYYDHMADDCLQQAMLECQALGTVLCKRKRDIGVQAEGVSAHMLIANKPVGASYLAVVQSSGLCEIGRNTPVVLCHPLTIPRFFSFVERLTKEVKMIDMRNVL